MKIALEESDRQFLEHLHRMGTSTVQQMCDEMDVTATAVRQRLSRLLERGLVSRRTVRSGRGRPHHDYRVTEAGLKELGDNYADLAMILWRELREIEEPTVRARVLERVRQALVARYGSVVQGESFEERLRQLEGALSDRGFDVEVDESGDLPILRENNCPYLELASSDPGICELEQTVFESVLGAEVKLSQCCLEGHHCCEFHAVEAGAEQ